MTAADECPGCIGRGLGTTCDQCGQPIPDHLILRPTDPRDPNPALDLYAFNATLAYLKEKS